MSLLEFRPPKSGVIVEWKKSRVREARALLPSGAIVCCPDYDTTAEEVDAHGRRLRGGNGCGVHWLPEVASQRVAAASVAALDAAEKKAEQDAEAVIRFAEAYASTGADDEREDNLRRVYRQYPDHGLGRYATAEDEIAAERARRIITRRDGWVLDSDSTCYPVMSLRDYGDPALMAALARRGLVLVWLRPYHLRGNPVGWRLCDPETAARAAVVDDLLTLLWAAGPQGDRRTNGVSLLKTRDDVMGRLARSVAWPTRKLAEDRALWAEVSP